MLVYSSRRKTPGAVLTTVAMLAVAACDEPEANTDLRPEGPPDVLAVLVFNDPIDGVIESATYCKPGDRKRPDFIGIPAFGLGTTVCPEGGAAVSELTDAYPNGWYVRIMFDELLDPDVEELVEIIGSDGQPTDTFIGTIKNTQPVTLQCEGTNGVLTNVPYDGYYSPAGNAVTWPVGPSLVIRPTDPTIVPVESRCQVTLKPMIKDKQGNSVPTNDLSPFSFRIAPIQVIGITPANDSKVNPEIKGVDVSFNVEIDAATLDLGTELRFDPPITNLTKVQASATDVFVYGDLLDSTAYTFTVAPGTTVTDKCGKTSTLAGPATVENHRLTKFTTNPLALVNITPFSGMNQRPANKIRLNFNQTMDPASIDATEYTISPVPDQFGGPTGTATFIHETASPFGDTSILRVNGNFQLGTTYTFTLKAGAKVRDCPQRYTTGVCAGTRELTIASDQTVTFTTAPQIEIVGVNLNDPTYGTTVAITGTGGQKIVKQAAADPLRVRFQFNQEIAGATFTASDFEFTKADGSPVPVPVTVVASTGSIIAVQGNLPAGSYRFTLKAGATVQDKLTVPNTYTQAADRTFTFNVEVAPTTPPFVCLGGNPT